MISTQDQLFFYVQAPARVTLTGTTLLAMATTSASINNSLPPTYMINMIWKSRTSNNCTLLIRDIILCVCVRDLWTLLFSFSFRYQVSSLFLSDDRRRHWTFNLRKDFKGIAQPQKLWGQPDLPDLPVRPGPGSDREVAERELGHN